MRRLGLTLGLLAACQGPPQNVANQCVPGWPAARTPAAYVAPLDATPALLWRARVTGGVPNDWIVLAGDQVAFTAGGRLFLRSRVDGSDQGGRSSVAFERVSSAVVDEAGHFHFVGQNAYSVDAQSAWRWLRPLEGKGGADYYKAAPSAGKTSALAPDGTLYVGASDGALYAIDTRDGTQKWRREVGVPREGDRGPTVLGGIGGALLATTVSKSEKPSLFDAQTGKPLQSWKSPEGPLHGVFFAPTLGIVTQHVGDHGGPYPWMDVTVLDRCGVPRWSLPASRPQWPVLIGPAEELYLVERDDRLNSPTFVSAYDPAGKRILGPVEAAPPWAIGKDGTIYAVQCDAPGHDGPSRLIAYGVDLAEKWRLELGDSCPSAGPVIGDDGKLYFTWYIDSGTELVAVQTTSPGLADAPWPARRRDQRGTAWVK